jgi:hypothetical protein
MLVSRPLRGVPSRRLAGQGPPQAACLGLEGPAHNQAARAQHQQVRIGVTPVLLMQRYDYGQAAHHCVQSPKENH